MQASDKARRGTRSVRSQLNMKAAAQDILSKAVKPLFEKLEGRQMLSTVYYVNDNWVVVTDNNSPGLDNGDVVADTAAGDNSLAPGGLVYGTNAFDNIASAVSAASDGDTIHISAGSYSTQTTINKQLRVEGDNAGTAGTATRVNESILNASSGSLVVAANNVIIDGLTIRDAASSGGRGVNVTSGSNLTIAHNIITQNSVGVVINNGVSNFVVSDNLISSNNRSGTNRGQGVRVLQNGGTGSIVRNTFTGHNSGATTPGAVSLVDSTNVSIGTSGNGNNFSSNDVGIRVSGASSSVSVVANTYTPANNTDLLVESTGTPLSSVTGNAFNASTNYISYAGTTELNAAGNTFGGTTTSGNSANLAAQYAVENKIQDGLDSSGPGLVRIDAGHIYVTSTSESQTAGALVRGVGFAGANETVHVGAGTFFGALDLNVTGLTITGAGAANTKIDVTGLSTPSDGAILVDVNNTTLSGFTLDETAPGTSSGPRYGIYGVGNNTLNVSNVIVQGLKRSGFNFNGSSNLTLTSNQSLNNGGAGIFMTDVVGAHITNTTTSGNPWTGIAVSTLGHFFPIGTSGIVIDGTNSFGESATDNGGLELEAANWNNVNPTAITWSTSATDNANVTIQASDFGYMLNGPQDQETYASPNSNVIRPRFYKTQAQAQSAAAGSPDHMQAHDRIIRTTGNFTQAASYYVYDVSGKMSVQAAINDSKSGDTINVGAGTFEEQLSINKNITLTGAGDSSVIKSPTSLGIQFTTGLNNNRAVVFVGNGGNGTHIDHLKIDGAGRGNGNVRMLGLAFYNAAGTADHITITGVRETPFAGSQHGVALYAFQDDATARTIHLTNNTISDYQKNGISVGGALLTVDIAGNTITGAGNQPTIAQNGIVVSNSATGTILNNTVSGNQYSGPLGGSNPLTDTQSVGILTLDTTGTVIISNNIVDGNDIGIYALGNSTINGNQLGNTAINRYEGIFLDQGTHSVTANAVAGGNIGLAVYSFGGNTAATAATVSGNTISGTGTLVHLFDDNLSDAYGVSGNITDNTLSGTGSGTGVDVDGATARLQDNNLANHLVGIHVAFNANVDAGSDPGDSDPTGLGTSTGNNILTGYTGSSSSGSYAIKNDNTTPDHNVYARNNNFGAVVTPAIVEAVNLDDSDGGGRTQIIYADPQNLAGTPLTVWVDDGWAGTNPGADADLGSGSNGSAFGYDQFSSIQDAINAVDTFGVVNVAAGNYVENLTLSKTVSIRGAQQGQDARLRTVALSPTVESIISPANGSLPLLDILGGSGNSVINGFAFSGGVVQVRTSSGPLNRLQVLNNRLQDFTGSAIVLNAGGDNMTFDKNNIDGGSQTTSAPLFLVGTDLFRGLAITANFIRNGGTNNTGLQFTGTDNVIASTGIGARNSQIGAPTAGNTIRDNRIGIDLGKNSFTGVISSNSIALNDLDGITGGPQSSTISQNTFDSNGRYALNFNGGGTGLATDGAQSTNVTNNFFKVSTTADIFLASDQFPGTLNTNHFNNNSFASPTAVIYNGTETIDLNFNWWSAASGPNGGGHIGSGSALAGTGAANLDVAPWVRVGTDIGGLASNGFQPDLTQIGHDAITLTGIASLNEGNTYTVTYAYNGDTDLSTVNNLIIDWGDGNTSNVPGALAPSGTLSHVYPDGPLTPTIQAFAVSPTRTYGMYPVLPVTVNNVVPSFSISVAPTTLTEGSVVTLSISPISDPGSENVSQYRINWGDGTNAANINQPFFETVTSATLNSTRFISTGPSTTVTLLPGIVTHTIADDFPTTATPDALTIQVGVIDDDAGGVPYLPYQTAVVTVSNQPSTTIAINGSAAPTVTAVVNGTVTNTLVEGSTRTLTFGIGKTPGVVDQYTYSWAITKNGGAYTQTAVSGTVTTTIVPTVTNAIFDPGGTSSTLTATPTFVFAPTDNGSYVVVISAVDNDGGNATTLTQTLQVANVAPVATISPTAAVTINEGATTSLTASQTDAGAADGPFTYAWNVTRGTVSITSASTSILAFNPTDNGTYVATLAVTDKDGGVGSNTKTIIVNNVNPTATISTTPPTSPEGTTLTVTGTQTDPGTADGPFTYSWTVATGTTTVTNVTTSASVFNFAPADQGTFVVSLVVRDKDGGASASVAKTITATNAAPTPSIVGAPTSSPEGTTIPLTAVANDPGSLDAITYVWSVSKDGGAAVTTTSTVASLNLAPTDNGVYVVNLTATDNSAASGVASAKTITVTNVAPTATITGAPVTSAEGSPITLSSTVTDPSPVDTFSYSWSVTKNGNAFGTTGTNAAYNFTPNDNGVYVVTLNVTDDDGGPTSTSSTITVTDIDPTIAVTGASSINEGSTYSLTLGAITDPAGANDTVTTYKIIWGDGNDTGFLVGSPSNGSVLTHVYDDGQNSNRTITVVLGDEDGLHNAASKSVLVNNVDPSGTFFGSSSVNLGDTGSVVWTTHSDPSTQDNGNLLYDYDFDGDGNYEVVSASPSATVPASYLNTVGAHTVKSRIRDDDGGATAVQSVVINVVDASLRVVPGSFVASNSGFTLSFNKSLVGSVLNIYDGDDAPAETPDVIVTAASNPSTPVRGSMVYDSATNTLTWVATGGVLPSDTYTLTLVSGANAFTHGGGDDLDGNTSAGGLENFTQNFTPAASSGKVISLPDFARGAGQNVRLPIDTAGGLPIRIDNPTGVTGADFDLFYNPQLLNITGATLAAGIPGDWTVTPSFTSISPTLSKVRITLSGATALSGSGLTNLVILAANVPNNAPYGNAEVLRIENVTVNAAAGRGDYAFHKAVYVGDVDRNASYTGNDKTYIDRVIAGLDNGFDAYDLVDPAIVADMDGNGVLNNQDSTWLAQKSLNASLRPEVPNLPGLVTLPGSGPDPTLDIPDNIHVTAGGVIDVPLQVIDSAAGMHGFNVTVTYDPSKINLAGGLDSPDVTLGALFTANPGWTFSNYVDTTAGTVSMLFSRTTNMLGGTGTIANMHFTVSGGFSGTSTLTPSGLASDGGLSYTYKSGTVTTDIVEFRVDAPQQAIVVTGNYTVGDLVLSGVPSGNIAASYNSGLNLTTFTFPGYANGVLPNGNYHAVIGGSKTLDFFVLAGDANRDRKVDISDLNILTTNYQQSGKVFSQGDFNYDGTVNSADLTILSANWQGSLAPGASAPVSTSAPATPGKRTATRVVDLTDLTK